MWQVEVSHKSEMAGPFNRGDTIINKHFYYTDHSYGAQTSIIKGLHCIWQNYYHIPPKKLSRGGGQGGAGVRG